MKQITFDEILAEAPQNFVIQNALEKCYNVVQTYNKIMCACSGGADSDVMVDMLLRCGAADKVTFVFFDTGIEYAATREHLSLLEEKYGITICREKPIKTVPVSVSEYGQPFWSKYASDMIKRLQYNGFKWEDRPFDELYKEYPTCKTALMWWCNVSKGRSSQYTIDRSPYMKEFIVANPPTFKISDKCCMYAKKNVSHKFIKDGRYDLVCTGIRKDEGGIRSATYKTCFSEIDDVAYFRPVFWFRDIDKEEYCRWYGIEHSKCYTEYGLLRTGCFGCPFGKRFEEELKAIELHEPRLLKAANNIFKDSYAYTRKYLEFREQMKQKKKRGQSDDAQGICEEYDNRPA